MRGVAGLRVADASTTPSIIAGNTDAPAMRIAETAARMLAHATRQLPPCGRTVIQLLQS